MKKTIFGLILCLIAHVSTTTAWTWGTALFGHGATSAASPRGIPFLDQVHAAKDVLVLDSPTPGYEPARTDAEWEPIFRENLFVDLKKYTDKVKRKGRLDIRDLGLLLRALLKSDNARNSVVVVLRGGRAYVGRPRGGMDAYVTRRVNTTFSTLVREAARLNLTLPDAVLGFNAADQPVCRLLDGCPVPIFSMFKRFSYKEKKCIDSDLLLPHMYHRYDRLLFFPWLQKDTRGVLRSTMQKSMSPRCVRVQLAELSVSPEGRQLLDVGFVRNQRPDYAMPAEFLRPYLDIVDHARWKFVVNADGHVASCRLGHVMQSNSVVLKQQSMWIEYYYRSLVPGVHLLEYNTSTVLPLLQMYRDPTRDGELRQLANASQHFVARYLTTEGKTRYAVRSLQEYAALFKGMSGFVQKLGGLNDSAPGTWGVGQVGASAVVQALLDRQ